MRLREYGPGVGRHKMIKELQRVAPPSKKPHVCHMSALSAWLDGYAVHGVVRALRDPSLRKD